MIRLRGSRRVAVMALAFAVLAEGALARAWSTETTAAVAGERVQIRPRFGGRAEGDADGLPRPGCPADDPCRIITEPRRFTPPPAGPTEIGEAIQIQDSIFMASGFGNTFLVTTSEGSVIIDTSISFLAPGHEAALRPLSAEAVKYIILTHGHADHIGGVGLWREPGTQVIAQESQVPFLDTERRLQGLFRYRNAAQFSELLNLPALPYSPPDEPVVNHGGDSPADVFFDRFMEFELGGLTFQIVHTLGETPDHATVWIPEYKIAFPGDNFYPSFPNLYTLRGTSPRYALDYVDSLNRVLSWEPEILAPSHGDPIFGREAVRQRLETMRDAILYVHDETVQGINAGKDVHTLMQEVKLPPALQGPDTEEVYGRVDWSVRGIFDGYVGWFDGNVSTMYASSPDSIDPELVEMAGGPDQVAARARELLDAGDPYKALHMSDVALHADAAHRGALEVRRDALRQIQSQAFNINERGWLTAALREVEGRLSAE